MERDNTVMKLNKGVITMKRYLPAFAALTTSLMSSAFIPSLKAGDWDKKTTIKISQPVAMQGTVLPAGQYVLKLMESPSSRSIVSVLNGDGNELITTIMVIPAERVQLSGKSEFSFYGQSEGRPAALHTWFYPGDATGFEFLRGK
jgi:hypothetical protein